MSDDFRFQDELAESAIERARALRPLLQETAAQTERERRVVPEVIEAIDEAGLFSIKLPRRWGGQCLPASAWSRVELELAKGCPSTAWTYHILSNGAWIASLGNDTLQEEVFADGIPRVAGGITPPGRAVPVQGGYRVSGRWPFNSGFHYANWRSFVCILEQPDGTVVPGLTVLVRGDEAQLDEDWKVAGMRGTGSHTGILEDVFVPAHRAALPDKPFGHHEPGKRHIGEPSDYWPTFQLVSTTTLGLLIGMAEAVFEDAVASVARRSVVYTTYSPAASSPVVQRNIGEAGAKIELAKLALASLMDIVDSAALERRAPDENRRARSRGLMGWAVEQMCVVVDKLMFASGANAFMDSSPMQRYWRDLNVASRHGFLVPDVNFEVAGRATLGIEPNIMPALIV